MSIKIKKIFSLVIGVAMVISMFSPFSLSMAQSNSAGGELTNATIHGAAGMQYVGSSSTAAHRTVAWTRTAYTGAVNVYYARESVNPGYCTAPDPATQGGWTIANGVGIVTSSYEMPAGTIAGLTDGTDYCLLIRSGSDTTPWAVTDQFEVDNTVPTISTRQTQDLNGNGKIDAIKITMSDEILDSTITIGNFATSHAEGLDATYNGTIGGVTFVNGVATGATADDTIFYLKLSEHGASDTETLPTLTYTAGTLTDLADNPLATTGAVAATDLAKPVITNAQWLDATADGNIDRVTLTFSEQVDVADGNAGDGLDSIVISDGASVTIDVADYVRTDQTTLTLNFTGDPITGTSITGLTIVYSDAGANTITDNAAGTPNEVLNGDVPEAYTDGALPVFLSSTTADLDGNGTVDQVTIVYSEAVSIVDAAGGAFDGVTFGDSCVAAAADYSSVSTTTSVVALTGCTAGDTSITADPTYASAAGAIIDLSGALNEMANAETVTGTDDAAPAILSSTGLDSDSNGKTDSYTITFSENLVDKGAAAANANFTARNATTLAGITIDTVGIGLTAGGAANKATLNLNNADTDNYTGIIEFSYNSSLGGAKIEDALLNTSDQTNVALSDDVLPVLLSSRGGNIGGNADVLNFAGEILDFAFSEPMNATAPTIVELEGGLTFANGAVDGTNLGGGGANTVTQVTTTIAGDTYRVTRVDTDSTNPITPGTDTVQVTLGTNIKDATGNIANTVPAAVTVAVADIAPPTFTSRETQDLDVNGKIDAIKITMNENIVDSTITIANFTTDHVGGVDATYNDTIGGIVFVNGVATGATADDAIFYVKIGEADLATFDTDATPTLTYTAGTLADSSNNLTVTDAAATTDKAAAVAISAVYKDATPDGQVDSVDITFSESVTLTAYADGEWSVPTPGTVIALADETAGAVTAADVITLTAAGAADKTGGGTDPQITYTAGTNVNDGLGNNTATFTITATDAAAPFVASKKYLDQNGDGHVDQVELTLTENQVTCTAEPVDFAYVANDITNSAMAGPLAAIACATNKVTLTLGVVGDANITSHTTAPTIAYLDDAGREISDAGGYQLATFIAGNLADGAGPVITAVREFDVDGDGKVDETMLTYSESIDDSNLVASDYTIGGTAADTKLDTTSTNTVDTNTADDAVITISVAAGVTGTEKKAVAYTAGTTTDLAGANLAPSQTFLAADATDSAKPIITAVREFDVDGDGKVDETMLTFSESISDASVVAADYTIGGTAADTKLATTSTNAIDTNTADDAVITISVAAGVTGTEKKAVVYTAGTTADLNTNTAITQTFASGGVTDSAKPIITAVREFDVNGDAKVDETMLTFSESISDASVVAADYTIGGTAADTKLDAAATNGVDTLVANDAVITISVAAGVTGTEKKAVVYTAGTTADVNTNTAITQIFAALGVTDSAAPIPLTASLDKAISNNNLQNGSVISITFSEEVTPLAVADGQWKFSRNGFEAVAAANWPDGSIIAYGSGATNDIVTMTLTGATTGTAWMNGAKLNLNADNTASITDATGNQADRKATDIVIAGLNGPMVDFVGVNAITSSSATITWTTGVNTTLNRVYYDTKANYDADHSLDLVSTTGTPGNGTRNHSIDLSALTAGTVYYFQACSTDASENCSGGQFTTSSAQGAGTLTIDGININPDKSYAINDNNFDHGWEWYISLTIPTTDPNVRLKFSDFAGTVGSIPATGNNIRYYSADDTNGHTTEGTAINVATVNTYPGDYLIFNAGSDQQADMPGYQVVVRAQVKVPVAATGGSYAGQFKVEATH